MMQGVILIPFYIDKGANLDPNLEGHFELSFIIANVSNLYTNIGGILNYL
jgi:hypothetical protein